MKQLHISKYYGTAAYLHQHILLVKGKEAFGPGDAGSPAGRLLEEGELEEAAVQHIFFRHHSIYEKKAGLVMSLKNRDCNVSLLFFKTFFMLLSYLTTYARFLKNNRPGQ